MSRSERFRLKAKIVQELDGNKWSWADQNLLMAEFELGSLSDDSYHGPTIADLVGDVRDAETLVELYSVVLDIDPEEVEADLVLSPSVDTVWRSGYVRAFLLYSADHADLANKVSEELAVVGVHGFVAESTRRFSEPWQNQIESALSSMDVFVGLVHEEFNSSCWCNQELGWALGRRTPYFLVRMSDDPRGFPARRQWPKLGDASPKVIATEISGWIAALPELGEAVFEGLLEALQAAGDYYTAEATSKRMAALGSLTDEQFLRLNEAWWSNNQLHGGILANRAMRPLYETNGKEWPPAKESAKADSSSTTSAYDPDSEPF